MGKVVFLGQRKPLSFLNKKAFLDSLKALANEKGFDIQKLTYIILNDEELLEINREHLNHDYYTDIITFDLSQTQNLLDSEIYISADRIKENAKSYDGYENEFLRVLFHGVLHLMGYKDKDRKDIEAMRAKENQCVTLYHRLAGN